MFIRRNRKGFTMVELMVVAVIVAILAAVAIPLMSGNKKRAMATEAEAALGSIRSAMRVMYAKTDAYNKNFNGEFTAGAGVKVIDTIPGFTARAGDKAGDLDGRWFSEECYEIRVADTNSYEIHAIGANSDADYAPRASDVEDIVITINQDGDITRSGL